MLFNLELDTNNSYRALGRLIKFYRVRSGYSLRDLGFLTNVSHTLIANIEQGKVKGNDETLKDIFKTLNIEFADVTEIFDDFKRVYDNVLDNLYRYEYTRAKIEMKKLLVKEQVFMHSVLITDYGLIKFLYNVLLGEEPKDQYIDINVFRGVQNYFSDRQKQIYLLIEGVDLFNKGEYSDAIDYLEKALKIGDSNFGYLVKLYLVKCYVKTFHFMKVVKIGNEAIDFFEDRIIYLRAMEVRLSIAYSYILNRNFSDAKELLESVYQFSNNFNAIYLIEEAKLLLGAYHLYLKEYEIARKYVYSYTLDKPIITFLKIRIAIENGDKEEARLVYKQFSQRNHAMRETDTLLIDIVAREIGFIEMDDDEFVKNVNKIIKFGEKAHDMEVIDSGYKILIRHYRNKRAYKKALDAAEKSSEIRKNGCLNRN